MMHNVKRGMIIPVHLDEIAVLKKNILFPQLYNNDNY